MLLEAWRDFESTSEAGTQEDRQSAVTAVETKMPKRVKRKRPLTTEDGLEVRAPRGAGQGRALLQWSL